MTSKSRLIAPILFSLASLPTSSLFLPLAHGQAVSTNGGSIQGTISDASGAAIPGANIVISSPATGYSHTLQTDNSGFYSLGPLVPGSYVVEVSAPSFQKLRVQTVIRTGTVTPGSEKLSIGNQGETVEVNAGQLQVNTDQPGVSGVITREQIASLPINGRNILDIAQIQPGVVLESGESFDPTKAGYSAVSVGGVSGRTTRILLDGQDITDETVGTTLFNVPAGAVDEFQLNRSTQDVSGEVTSTGQVLVATRSGTNSIHGQLFYNFQDNNAGFAEVNGFNAPFQRNQFGGNIGGPIIKDKLFFFADIERVKQDEENAANTSATFADIQSQYPLFPAPFRDTFSTVRLDYNAPKGVHLFARGVYSVNSDTSNFGFLYSVYSNRDNVPGIVGGADFTTGKFTHSFRVGYEKFHNLLGDATAAYGSSLYDPFPLGGAIPGITLYDPTDSFFAGSNYLAPQQTYQSDKQFRYDGTWTRGTHSLKFGGEVNRILNGGFADFFGAATRVSFSPSSLLPNCGGVAGQPACPGDPVNGYSATQVLIGNGNGYFSENPGFGSPNGALSSWRVAAYAADTWKVTPSFTLVAGLRWSVDTDRANQDLASPLCSSLDPDLQFTGCTGNTYLFDQYQQGLGGRTHQPYANFGPQAGFVFSPGAHKLSIRLGGGIFYESSIFNNTGNARPESITAKGAYFNDALPCSNFFPGSSLDYSSTLINGQSLSAICGMSIANAAPYFGAIRTAYQAQTLGVATANPNYIGSANGYDLYADNIYAKPYVSPYSIQLNGGVQQQVGKGVVISADYVHNATLKVPLSVDVNHVGAARYLDIPSAQAAIAATLAPNLQAGYAGFPMCPQGFSSVSIDCAIANGATIADFAGNGLDSGNNGFSTSGTPAVQSGAAFGGRNRNVGTGQFILPIGRSGYDALQLVLQQQATHPVPGIVSSNLQVSYTLSRVNTETASTTSTEDQFFGGALAWDFDQPNAYIGRSTLDHLNEVSFGGSLAIKYGVKVGFIGHFFSAPAQSLTLDNQEYSGQGEIFRTDVTGDGTTGDLVPGTNPGYYMHQVKGGGLNQLISSYNATHAGQPTPAGQALIAAGLFNQGQLAALKGVQQPIATAPTTPIPNAATRTFDLNASYPISLGRFREGLSLEPGVAMYNVFNMSNFTGASTVLLNTDDAGGTSGTVPGYFNGPNNQAALNQFRIERGSGTFDQGAPRTTEFQLRLNF